MPSESNNNTKWRVGNPKSDWSNKRWYPAWLVLWDGFFRCTCWWMACPYLLFHWKQFDRILYCLWDKRKIRGTYLWFYLFWRMDWLCNKLLLNGEFELTNIKSISFRSTVTTGWLLHISIETNDSHVFVIGFDKIRGVIAYIDGAEIWEITPVWCHYKMAR